MVHVSRFCLVLIGLGIWVQPMTSRPEFYQIFLADPFRAEDREGCVTCHIDPNGGGPRNEFGLAFAAEGRVITPMLRSNWLGRFDVATTEVAGATIYFSDPESRFLVAEVEGERTLVDLLEGGYTGLTTEDEATERVSPFNFFITSEGSGNGANLGGLIGADRHCQSLAESAGFGYKGWQAYLSTSIDGGPAINAGDRIGNGPWYNSRDVMIGWGVSDLHGPSGRLSKELALTETGEIVNGVGDTPNQHDILTGTLADGTAAIGMTCENWTSTSSESSAMVGHSDRQGGGDGISPWNSAHASRGCSQENLESSGGAGLFYCFAID